MRPRTPAALVSVVACTLTSPSFAGNTIDPRGVYFHSYTGPFSATEWIHIWEIEGERRYEFSDIRGLVPYRGTITTQGAITWDTTANTSGSGAFLSQNRASQTLVFNGSNFPSELYRAPGTDAEFITQIDSREQGDTSLSGQWSVLIEALDPMSGDVLSTRTERFDVLVTDELVRLTSETGDFMQGVFETDDHAGFRVVVPGGLGERFRSFEGSETNTSMNILGDLRYDGADTFTATMLLQSRAAPGPNQHQFIERYTASRVPAPGGALALGLGAMVSARRRR